MVNANDYDIIEIVCVSNTLTIFITTLAVFAQKWSLWVLDAILILSPVISLKLLRKLINYDTVLSS